jgi:hypothetical protein
MRTQIKPSKLRSMKERWGRSSITNLGKNLKKDYVQNVDVAIKNNLN